MIGTQTHKYVHFLPARDKKGNDICDVIKQNELEVANIDFDMYLTRASGMYLPRLCFKSLDVLSIESLTWLYPPIRSLQGSAICR